MIDNIMNEIYDDENMRQIFEIYLTQIDSSCFKLMSIDNAKYRKFSSIVVANKQIRIEK